MRLIESFVGYFNRDKRLLTHVVSFLLVGFLVFLMYRQDKLSNALRLLVSVPALLLIFSVPFSRVYLGAHSFTDVLAGFIVGLLCLIALARSYSSRRFRADQGSQA